MYDKPFSYKSSSRLPTEEMLWWFEQAGKKWRPVRLVWYKLPGLGVAPLEDELGWCELFILN
jgi:hypothetical protein